MVNQFQNQHDLINGPDIKSEYKLYTEKEETTEQNNNNLNQTTITKIKKQTIKNSTKTIPTRTFY